MIAWIASFLRLSEFARHAGAQTPYGRHGRPGYRRRYAPPASYAGDGDDELPVHAADHFGRRSRRGPARSSAPTAISSRGSQRRSARRTIFSHGRECSRLAPAAPTALGQFPYTLRWGRGNPAWSTFRFRRNGTCSSVASLRRVSWEPSDVSLKDPAPRRIIRSEDASTTSRSRDGRAATAASAGQRVR